MPVWSSLLPQIKAPAALLGVVGVYGDALDVLDGRELGEYLIWKYNDGFIKNEGGGAESKGYPEDWLREVVKNRPDQFLLDANE